MTCAGRNALLLLSAVKLRTFKQHWLLYWALRKLYWVSVTSVCNLPSQDRHIKILVYKSNNSNSYAPPSIALTQPLLTTVAWRTYRSKQIIAQFVQTPNYFP